MRRRYLLLAPVAVAASVGLLQYRASSRPPTASIPTQQATVPSHPRFVPGQRVPQARYRLTFEQYAIIPGQGTQTLLTEGEWIATPRMDGRIEARFSPTAIDGPPNEMAAASELAAPAQLV